MKAPEKIYLYPYSTDGIYEVETKPLEGTVEYTRTDVFIEKAAEWLKKNADNYTWYDETEGESGMIDSFIDDFKNYMKGE